ncbi:histidine kinase [Nonomuraea sp. NPDC046570]|uniref:sensor histidine kinase n=1 Tax=Nonomuraea sp. NPDC046570 TaxID=3155255 RepID=UPI0033D0EE37
MGFAGRVWRFVRRPRVLDTALVMVFCGFPLVGGVWMYQIEDHKAAVAAVLFFAASLPLLVRRSRPLTVTAVTVSIDTVGLVIGVLGSLNLASVVALYSAGRYAPGRHAVIAAALASTPTAVSYWVRTDHYGNAVAPVLATFLYIGAGQFVRLRGELKERREREAADNAVRAERRRIARELHDVVAHHLTVINALVGGARSTMTANPVDARDALLNAEQTSRAALAEMRQLLHVLRADGESADAATGVGVAGLTALVEQARRAGLPASLRIGGTPATLPAAVDHAVYRIVQEALTNTRKHAAGARASVRLGYQDDEVEVEVLDDGVGRRNGSAPESQGFGLGGMAERVALCGGRLETGPRPEGGFRVYASLPIPAEEAR